MAEYVIKVILCQVILFLFYQFFLSKEKIHQFNRFYLVFALLFSVIIPLISIPVYFPTAIDFSAFLPSEKAIEPIQETQTQQTRLTFPFTQWLTIIYLASLLLFGFRMVRNLFRINLVAIMYNKSYYKGYELVLTENKILPYSFLKRIFVNQEDYETGKIGDELFMHEIYHIQQRHTFDIIVMEVVQALFWFNPLLILHNRAIRLNHEYLADQAVLNNDIKVSDYQNVLIDAVSEKRLMPITSGFSAIWTKKRLLMMGRNKSMTGSLLKVLLAIPVVTLLALSFIFSTEESEQSKEKRITEIFNEYPNFVGNWEGSGGFMNVHLKKEVGPIPFSLKINTDNTIEGRVGDATLSDFDFYKRNYGIEVQAHLSQPVRDHENIDKELIIILWCLPEIEENKVDCNFHLVNNFTFDPYFNVGGMILEKTNDLDEHIIKN